MGLNFVYLYGYGFNHKFRKIASHCFGKTLDMGCATRGNPFIPSPAVGLDVRPLAEWAPMPPNYVKRIICDARKINFKEKFDCISASELIEHLYDPYAFIKKSHELLKPKGRLIVTTDNPYRLQTLVANALFPKGLGKSSSLKASELGHVNFLIPRMLNVMTAENGFKVLAVECGGGLPFPFLQQKFVFVYEKQ